MKPILISVVLPSFNAANTIRQAINSLIYQTFEDFEILIGDDASTDNTIAVVRDIQDCRIRLFINEENIGPGKTRDFLIRQAKGRWVAVLDADDVYEPTRLEIFYEIAKKHPDAIIFDDIMECHDTDKGLVPWGSVRGINTLMGDLDNENQKAKAITPGSWLRCERIMMQWMASTELIIKHNIKHPDIRFGEDLGFIFRLLNATKSRLYYIPEPLYFYRLSSGSLTTSPNRFVMLLEVLNEAMQYDGLDTDTLAALKGKAISVEKRIVYQKFLTALVRLKIFSAISQTIKNPWLVPEFIKRVFERMPYHLHRKRHKGSKRETA